MALDSKEVVPTKQMKMPKDTHTSRFERYFALNVFALSTCMTLGYSPSTIILNLIVIISQVMTQRSPPMRRKMMWKRKSIIQKVNSLLVKLDIFSYIISLRDYYNFAKKNLYLIETNLIVGRSICVIPYVERHILQVALLVRGTYVVPCKSIL